ncbi:MAG TPA: hypothetical protein VII00_02030 [bacterium]
MKKIIIGLFTLLFLNEVGYSTPSTTFWAPSTHYVQPFGILHITYDTYFRGGTAYPVDTGLTVGVLPFEKLQMEVGYDLFFPGSYPLSLNGKIGSPEGAFFSGSPGWSAGIFGVGFKKDATDYNILHIMFGKTFSYAGIFGLGGYYGFNKDLLTSSDGEENNTGIMASWFSPDISVSGIEKLMLAWDIMTGKNIIGATGGGLYIYFTPAIDLLIGPVYFFDSKLQPGETKWLWSVQIDIDVDLKIKR